MYLLADVFENVRDMCLEYYQLDPAHYYTLPNFAWDAMFKKTNVRMDMLCDLDMCQKIESGLRGGAHLQANNKYMADYNQDGISNYIMYLDANSLYSCGMVAKLPCSDFKWSTDIKNSWRCNEL